MKLIYTISKWRSEIMWVILLTIFALVFTEFALRALVALEPVVIDPVLGLRPQVGPGTDADGFPSRKNFATATIVTFGDSTTLGPNGSVDQSWPMFLGLIGSTTVYNMGITSSGPVQYAALFDQALSLHPKVVIVGFNLVNGTLEAYDMVYTHEYWKSLRSSGFPDQQKRATGSSVDEELTSMGLARGTLSYRIHQVGLWVRAHSLMSARLADVTRPLRERIGFARTEEGNIKDLEQLTQSHADLKFVAKDAGLETVLTLGHRGDGLDLSLSQTREGWRISKGRFHEIADKAKRDGVRLVILMIPPKEKVYVEHWKLENGKIPQEFEQYEKTAGEFTVEVKKFCLEEKIECLDPTHEMALALGEGKRLYGGGNDGHPTVLGHRVIAEITNTYFLKSKTRL